MKNIYVENLKRRAKIYHQSNKRNRHLERDILVHHIYAYHEDLERLTWWDDFGFILNDYKVAVAWEHPRQRYADEIKDLAYSLVQERFPEPASEHKNLKKFFKQIATPNYIKVGKSRKKIQSLNFDRDFINGPLSNRFEESKKIEQIIGFTSEIEVKPSINSRWTNRSRFVSLCLPIEIRSESDLNVLASIVKRLLKRETTLDELFPDYVYTKDDWLVEKDLRVPNDLHSHLIA